MSDFVEKMQRSFEASVLKLISSGDWVKIDYNARVDLDQGYLNAAFANLDHDRIRSLVQEKLEERIADKVIHAMATEVSNDVKSVVTNAPLRENLRFMIRDAIRDAAKPITEDSTA